jgi:hypothetical protein
MIVHNLCIFPSTFHFIPIYASVLVVLRYISHNHFAKLTATGCGPTNISISLVVQARFSHISVGRLDQVNVVAGITKHRDGSVLDMGECFCDVFV